MKACRIKGIVSSKVYAEKYTDIYLCDFCFLADAKRGDDAQVLSFEEYTSEESISCDACFVSLETERRSKVPKIITK
jgi:catabolite regulation protein CreA